MRTKRLLPGGPTWGKLGILIGAQGANEREDITSDANTDCPLQLSQVFGILGD